MRALSAAGFNILRRQPEPAAHVAAELARPGDVGYLDLHQRPPGPPGLADNPSLGRRCSRVRIEGGWAHLPDPAAQILHLVLHDQFHDGGYWRGGFDLRHLLDIARLAPALSTSDRAWLDAACGGRLARAALEAQMFSAAALFGAAPPASSHAARTYRRWRLQHAYPALRIPLAAAALALEWRDVAEHRTADRQWRMRVWGSPAVTPFAPFRRLERLLQIVSLAPGKI